MLSLIIPVLNEELILKENFSHIEKLKTHGEVIFVDGASCDETVAVASRLGRVLEAEAGRAKQMNCGARAAKGDILLFLHADSFLNEEAIYSARECIKNGAIGGCFTQRLNNEKHIYRVLEGIGNKRARKEKVFYGDQGIFVRKDIFFSIGAFPEVPIMEDILFSKALRKQGRLEVLDKPIYVSTRRWEKKGVFKTNLLYIGMILLSCLNIPGPLIRRLYKDVR